MKYKFPYIDHFNIVLNNKPMFNYMDHVHFIGPREYVVLPQLLLNILVQHKFITPTGEIVK